ncbi:MAG: methyltransferase domain-containing protein [archaeon]
MKGKTILSVGSGEWQNFMFLLKKYYDENSLYIAIDIFFAALKLNRCRNTHKNSLYILCSTDYELPFQDSTIDVLCYFGILHHTKNKSNNIKKDKRVVQKNGYIILAEAVDRPILPPTSYLMKTELSAHEEHVRKNDTFIHLTKKFKVIFVKEQGTPLFTGMMKYFYNIMIHNKILFIFLLNLDVLIIRTFGRIIPFFRRGEILLLARRNMEMLQRACTTIVQ